MSRRSWPWLLVSGWDKLSSILERVLENPVTLITQQSNDGWAVVFELTDFNAKELFYKLDGAAANGVASRLRKTSPTTVAAASRTGRLSRARIWEN